MRGYRAGIAFDGERPMPGGALVLVDDGVIVGVEPASSPAPDGCPVTDAPALLPGLIDTHVHLCGDSSVRALDQFAELSRDRLQAIIATAEQQHLRAGRALPQEVDVGGRHDREGIRHAVNLARC